MSRPKPSPALIALCRLYVGWQATTPGEKAVEECLRRLVDEEIRNQCPHAYNGEDKSPSPSGIERIRDSWSWN